jgi:hypothetical protein
MALGFGFVGRFPAVVVVVAVVDFLLFDFPSLSFFFFFALVFSGSEAELLFCEGADAAPAAVEAPSGIGAS